MIKFYDMSEITKRVSDATRHDVDDIMKQNNFNNCSYRNLSGGIVAIHSGWKI